MKRNYDCEIGWEQIRNLFPLASRILERQVLRVETLRTLKERSRGEDEAEQLKKLEAREMLKSLVKLEEWK